MLVSGSDITSVGREVHHVDNLKVSHENVSSRLRLNAADLWEGEGEGEGEGGEGEGGGGGEREGGRGGEGGERGGGGQ